MTKINTATTYLVNISYLGTHYSGIQRQTKNPNTIQQVIETTLSQIMGHAKIGVIIASRTDTGVHALCQYIKFTLPKKINEIRLKKILNHKLPLDIRVHDLKIIDKKFNLQQSLSKKVYRYYFCHDCTPSALASQTIYTSYKTLAIAEMKKAARMFKGTQDLKHFCVRGKRTPNTLRKIHQCEIVEDPNSTGIYYLEITSDGFLKYMVRFIMGTLLRIGEGHFDSKTLKNCLTNIERQPLPYKAPPIGLQLYHMEVSTK